MVLCMTYICIIAAKSAMITTAAAYVSDGVCETITSPQVLVIIGSKLYVISQVSTQAFVSLFLKNDM